MPPEAIAQVVRDLPKSNDPRLIVGAEGFSDAGVFKASDELALVQSLDFFAPLVDDPFVFGEIAAANSLSDIYAMGAQPTTALNIVCFPDNKLGLDILSEILRGGTEKVLEAGATVVGGHTVRDDEIKFGLSVTGIITPDNLITNQGAQPGDILVLTKALGTGFITTAIKANKCDSEHARIALESMSRLNKAASEGARAVGAHAATDITGFGLAIHGCELAQASEVTLEIELDRLPILPGALDYFERGLVTRASASNRQFSRSQVQINSQCDPSLLEICFDPQTSGGLLVSVPEGKAEELISQTNSNGISDAKIIGRVQSKQGYSVAIN